MKTLSHFFHNLSTGWVTLAALLVFTLFAVLVLPAQTPDAATKAIGVPDLALYYTSQDLYCMADAYGEEGRVAYIQGHFTFDVIWPLVYTTFLICVLSWLTRRGFAEGSSWQYVNLLPLLAALFDFLENASTSLVMYRYPTRLSMLAALAGIFTTLKWVFVGMSFLALLIALGAGAWNRKKTLNFR